MTKTYGLILLSVALSSPLASAQDSYNNGLRTELNREVEEMYPEAKPQPRSVRVETREIVETQPVQSTPPVEVNQVHIQASPQVQGQAQLQQQAQQPIMVRQQPLTLVEAAPVVESDADKLRRSRVEFEQETERKLVEKLEAERIQAEQERRKNIMEKLEGKPVEPVQEEVAPVYPPVPVVVEQEQTIEAVAPVQTAELPEAPKEEDSGNSMFIGLNGGVGSFIDADNVEGTSGGVSVGIITEQNIVAEFGFNYGSFEIDTSSYFDPFDQTSFDEYAFSLGVSYQFLRSVIRPVAGVLMQYRYRDYVHTQYSGYRKPNEDVTTHGIDFGINLGVDFAVTESFTFGLGMKYLINMYNDIDGIEEGDYYKDYSYGYYDYGYGYDDYEDDLDSVEEKNYYIFGANAKFIF